MVFEGNSQLYYYYFLSAQLSHPPTILLACGSAKNHATTQFIGVIQKQPAKCANVKTFSGLSSAIVFTVHVRYLPPSPTRSIIIIIQLNPWIIGSFHNSSWAIATRTHNTHSRRRTELCEGGLLKPTADYVCRQGSFCWWKSNFRLDKT